MGTNISWGWRGRNNKYRNSRGGKNFGFFQIFGFWILIWIRIIGNTYECTFINLFEDCKKLRNRAQLNLF